MFGNNYDPADWYWFVAGDTDHVWSSRRMGYFSIGDAEYQEWITLSPYNYTSTIPSKEDLSVVMQEHTLPLYLFNGITIASDSTPGIDAAYSVDAVTMNQIGEVARDFKIWGTLPMNAPAFVYPNKAGEPMTLSGDNVVSIYTAAKNYIASLTYAIIQRVMGADVPLPSSTIGVA